MALFHDSAIIGASGAQGGYKIERSLRFNSADSAYLSRTPASAGNRKTWTWSGWVKRSKIGVGYQVLFSGAVSQSYCLLWFSDDQLGLDQGSVYTTAVFRDPAAWLHVVCSVDTTNPTASDRLIIYVNGVRQANATYSAPSQNFDTFVNQAVEHRIGRFGFNGYEHYLAAYLADIHFIDGQALTPSSFGETDINGIWQPKRYTGTYGTNGFQLKFADNSAATATTLGKDTSGNGNNWTPNNLSITAGAGNDSLVDSPTNYGIDTGAGGEVRGNYATLNPLDKTNQFGSGLGPLSNGNLELVGAASTQYTATSTIQLDYNCYSEFVGGTQYVGFRGVSNSNLYCWFPSTSQYYNNGSYENVGVTYSSTDVVSISFNPSTLTATFYKNGASQFSKTLPSGSYVFIVSTVGAGNCVCNFGQRQWAYAAPAGFKALCTQNLPAPTITKPSTVMDVKTWNGPGSGGAARTFTGYAFSPDLVWVKSRSSAFSHRIYDSVRGAGVGKSLISSSTSAETNSRDGNGYISAFTGDGFSILDDGSTGAPYADFNRDSESYVGWCWDAGSSTVTNTSGTISSQVRANVSAGFSIVTYTGNGSNGATVGHGLGVSPGMVIVKARSAAYEWPVYHSSLSAGQGLFLNYNVAAGSVSSQFNWGGIGGANSTTFTCTQGVSTINNTNLNGNTYVAYCFAPVAGYSSFGSYTGNGSSDGPFVYTGFRPRWVMVKCAGTASNWFVYDTARDVDNVVEYKLYPNDSAAENGVAGETLSTNVVDILSNGFKLRNTNGSNFSAQQYIYAAFAENPFQYARAR